MSLANVLAKEVAGDLWGRDASFIADIKSITSWEVNTVFTPKQGTTRVVG